MSDLDDFADLELKLHPDRDVSPNKPSAKRIRAGRKRLKQALIRNNSKPKWLRQLRQLQRSK